MEKKGITFSGVIIESPEKGVFYGVVKELEGVIVKGKTEDEVVKKIPMAIHSIMEAKRKNPSPKTALGNLENQNFKEFPFNYEAV
jgi:predicted RNase H-like HicB family nuclease